jgi:hypothetical protein
MPGRHLLNGLLVLTALSCGSGAADGEPPGTFIVERDGQRILAAQARASRCPLDSTIAIAVVSPDWSAALAFRAAWPTDSAHDVAIGQILAPGTAVLAVRPLADSIREALISANGTLTLEPGPPLSGRADALAPATVGAPDSVRLTARFTGITVHDDLCPVPGTP